MEYVIFSGHRRRRTVVDPYIADLCSFVVISATLALSPPNSQSVVGVGTADSRRGRHRASSRRVENAPSRPMTLWCDAARALARPQKDRHSHRAHRQRPRHPPPPRGRAQRHRRPAPTQYTRTHVIQSPGRGPPESTRARPRIVPNRVKMATPTHPRRAASRRRRAHSPSRPQLSRARQQKRSSTRASPANGVL